MGSQNILQGTNLVFLVATFSVLIIIGDHNVAAHIHLAPEGSTTPSSSSNPVHDDTDGPAPLPPFSYISYAPTDAPAAAPGSGSPSSSPPVSEDSITGDVEGNGGAYIGAAAGVSLAAATGLNSAGGASGGISSGLDFQSGLNLDFNIDFMNAFSGDLTKLAAGCDEKVKKMCENTDFPEICVATIVPVLEKSGKSGADLDTTAVWGIAIKASYGFANYSYGLLQKASAIPGLPEDVVSALEDCKDSFESIQYNFENVITAMATHDVGTMSTMLSAVMTESSDCEEGFKGLDFDCPVAGFADKLVSMTSNALAIGSVATQT